MGDSGGDTEPPDSAGKRLKHRRKGHAEAAGASSLLLARARASGSVAGVTLMSVDDLFSDDDEAGGKPQPPPASQPRRFAESDDDSDASDAGGGRGAGASGEHGRSSSRLSAIEREARARLEEELLAIRREIAALDGGELRVDGPRSEHANVRDEDAALRWPPTESDYQEDAREFARRGQKLSRRDPPEAHALFSDELEDHLTTLVMMMALEDRALGPTPILA